MKGDEDLAEVGIAGLMKIIFRFLVTFVSGIAGWQSAQLLLKMNIPWIAAATHPNLWTALAVLLFAAAGYLLTPLILWLLRAIGQAFENALQSVSLPDIGVALIGLIVSLLLANLMALPFFRIPGIGFYVAVAFNVIFAYVGIRAFLKRRDEIWHFITNARGLGGKLSRRSKNRGKGGGESGLEDLEVSAEESDADRVSASQKVLDTSALIDGRILDIAQTGFIEGTLLLPRFVLAELQGVADSSDPMRRARGRRGLSVVSELQKIKTLDVRIMDVTLKELKRDKVDEALVELCKRMTARILTTDYNLNQIARIEGVAVLNVNDLANSLKPQFLPGEVVKIDVIRPGKEPGQGIGYLEDGTMLVVEDGESGIGTTSDVTITSMLQTSAGRMVFGRLRKQ